MIKLELYKKRNKLKNIKKNLKGTIVPVPSFYKDNLNLDYDKLGKFIDFQLKNNINNFYLALSASEFEFMSEKERISIAKFISKIIPKKSILLSQPIGSGSLESQIDEGKRMIDAGADALVIKPQSLKENANFFSSKYLSRSYSPKKHDGFYISFMEKFSISTKCPLVYHDHPFSNGFGLSLNGIKELMKNKFIEAFKVHTPDPGHLKNQYNLIRKKTASFDGFGKTLQFWSLQWGATARHSCWSWFEPNIDNKFFKYMINKKFKEAIKIINRETPIIDVIRITGFPGYKELMRLSGLPYSKSRIPGEKLSLNQRKLISKAYKQIKKIKIV